MASLAEQVEVRGLAAHVHLLGRRDDVPALMAAADVFVLPSLFEGLPLAVLEAMALGLPAVGTRVCGTAEAVHDGETGRLVAPGDVTALTAALLEVLDHPGRAAGSALAGQALAQREFSAARMARETAAIYDELLSQRRIAAQQTSSS